MAQTQALRCAQDGQWLVARDAERLLGCVDVALPPPGVGEISLLAKRPTGEGTGLGRALLGEAERALVERRRVRRADLTVLAP